MKSEEEESLQIPRNYFFDGPLAPDGIVFN